MLVAASTTTPALGDRPLQNTTTGASPQHSYLGILTMCWWTHLYELRGSAPQLGLGDGTALEGEKAGRRKEKMVVGEEVDIDGASARAPPFMHREADRLDGLADRFVNVTTSKFNLRLDLYLR